MPVGTGAETLQNIPAQPFVTDPALFFQLTRQNVITPAVVPSPGPGLPFLRQLLQSGVVTKLRLTFVGNLNVVTAAVTTSDQWPYNLLKDFKLSANGQNDLISCDGIDLTVLRDLRYPSFVEAVDQFPGTIGGGDSVAVDDHPLTLNWEVPIAMDDVSLVGALFAQSSATNLTVRAQQALNADLFSANPGNATITGTWHIEEVLFDLPFDSEGNLVVPDLSRLHGFNSIEIPFVQPGEVRLPLIRSAGQLSRLFVSASSAANTRLSAQPSAADTRKLDTVRLEYGGNQRPYVFNPASTLLMRNNQHYGGSPLYDRLVWDFVKENPIRDVILMQGVTELAAVLTVNAAVSVTAGRARLVQESLF